MRQVKERLGLPLGAPYAGKDLGNLVDMYISMAKEHMKVRYRTLNLGVFYSPILYFRNNGLFGSQGVRDRISERIHNADLARDLIWVLHSEIGPEEFENSRNSTVSYFTELSSMTPAEAAVIG
ncbi:Uu.00g050590.m01.CDS01 [Anthostomella pinea]|uniref:Uu.00g050590.m01.CDS01 n=1 Tax=Anthostomella pinea TaxID=933095 RepID=A0AAI8VSP9_9PEZI|nr:Uu.00g050590.m01.CDS01 [Anthostomella pinea]